MSREYIWDQRFLNLARLVASWSKDPRTQVGSVIVRPNRTIASLGFNGFPMGMNDEPALYNDRAVKHERVIHAEMNAILFATDPSLQGYTCYTWRRPPCPRCAVHLLQKGIRRYVFPPPTQETSDVTNTMLGYLQEAKAEWVIVSV
jgi:dCMP deaminase